MTERTISIFPIGKPELARVQALAQRIWPMAYADILPPERIQPMVNEIYAPETLAADIDVRGHRYWLATVDGADAGFASAYRDGDRVWIKKLYVLDTARGLRLGKRQMATAIAAFPGATSVGLYVNNGNAPAICILPCAGLRRGSGGAGADGTVRFCRLRHGPPAHRRLTPGLPSA